MCNYFFYKAIYKISNNVYYLETPTPTPEEMFGTGGITKPDKPVQRVDTSTYASLIGRYKDDNLPGPTTELVRRDGEQEIRAYGVDHDLHSDTLQKLVEEINTDPPDICFVELFPSFLPLVYACPDQDTAFKTFGESGYIAWLANQKGISVRSWDNSLTERLEDGYRELGNDGVEALLGSFVCSGMIHVITGEGEQHGFRAERFMEAIKQAGIYQEVAAFFEKHGIVINEDSIRNLFQKYAGKDIDSMTKEEVSRLFEPYGDGPINNANRVSNEPRDNHAIAEFLKAKAEGARRITVLTGIDHTRLWQRPLEAMYPNELKKIAA